MKKNRGNEMRLGVGKKFPVSPALFVVAESLLMTFVLEILSRRSLGDAWAFLTNKPVLFLYNAVVVSVTLALGMMFRKKALFVTLISVLWLGFGIANCILLSFRAESPLVSVDLQLGMEAIAMMPKYFKIWQIILIFAAIAGAIALLVFLGIRSPRYRGEGQKAWLRLCCFVIAFLAATVGLFSQPDMISRNFRPSLYRAYKEYGFPYCFLYSFFDVGIRKPEHYSSQEIASISGEIGIDLEIQEDEDDETILEEFIESVRLGVFDTEPEHYTVESVNAIRELLKRKTDRAGEIHPNIIFVQLESFFDPTLLKGVELSGDPIPNFRALSGQFTSGKLAVPTVSGGTSNTEFEVLTGCSLDFFGVGEFPYYSILRKETCESMATDLRVLGYRATGVHSYTGSFYYRNTVYQNLGFNRFVSLEYMDGFETNPIGWAKDACLIDEIQMAVRSTEERDFVYAITMQTHGSYMEFPQGQEAPITVSGMETEHDDRVMEFYLSQMLEADSFVKALTDAFKDDPEETIIVFFGDHLPSAGIHEEMMPDGDVYQTRYVIWDNFGLQKKDRDLETYQLGAYVFDQADIDIGVMIRFHQNEMDEAEYESELEILEYDMLYGKRYIYGQNEYENDEIMQMGFSPIEITEITNRYGNLFVEGEHFTYASRVLIDDDEAETVFVNSQLLIVPGVIPEEGSAVSVAQISGDGVTLSVSSPVLYEGM